MAVSPAEMYSQVYEPTYYTLSMQSIRRNIMAVPGEEVLPAAMIGLACATGMPEELSDVHALRPYLGDLVATGAEVAFRMLGRVLHPGYQTFGPGNFTVEPCDENGQTLISRPLAVPDTLRKLSSEGNRNWWLGDSREEVWQSTAVGITLDAMKGQKGVRKAQKAARHIVRDHVGPTSLVERYAFPTFDNAVEVTRRAVVAEQNAVPVKRLAVRNNLFVKVVPVKTQLGPIVCDLLSDD